MNGFKIIEVFNDNPTEDDMQRYQEGLQILARIIAKAWLEDTSRGEGSQHGECRDLAVKTCEVGKVRETDEPLALSIKKAARLLGLSQASVYRAVRTGQIPSVRLGTRIVIPRAALDRMLADAEKRCSEGS